MSKLRRDQLLFKDGVEEELLIEWLRSDYDIKVIKRDGLFYAYTLDDRLMCISKDPKKILDALIILIEGGQVNAKTEER